MSPTDDDVSAPTLTKRRRRASPTPRANAITIADVASLAGVSTATVSRALSMPEAVAEATRNRVLEAVRLTGYTPNVAARSLRAARSMMVLAVVPSLITPFFSELLLGVDQSISRRGYGLLIGNMHDDADKEARLVQLVLSGQVDGVILLDGRILRGATHSILDAAVPIVAVSRASVEDVVTIRIREREASAAVAEHLLGLGHRRFGYVAGPVGNPLSVERWEGFSRTLMKAGIAPETIVCFPGDFHAPTGITAAQEFLALAEQPTAVFAVADSMAISFLATIRKAGIIVPRDLSLVGFDGISFSDYCEPPLTTIRQPREEMGRLAAEILIRMIDGEVFALDERTRWLDAPLRIAGSTGPPPAT